MATIKHSFRSLTIQGCLALLLAGGAAAEALPFESSASDETARFGARLDIQHVAQPLLTLSNAKGEASVAIDVVAIDEDDHQHRLHTVRLEAGGQTVLGFDSLVDFEILVLSGQGEFAATLEDAYRRTSPQAIRIVPARGARAFKSSTVCDGTWNLSCIAPSGCTFVSGYKSGRVQSGNQVYWNLHTPTGSWTTVGGGCSTTWYDIQANGCPARALNCLGQTYAVTPNIPKDLIITNITLGSPSVESGDDVVVNYRVENVGNTTVKARYQERFLLKPSSGSAYEVFLGSTHGQDIAPGSYVSLAKTVDIFGSAGSYTLEVEADFGDAISESNEGNNVTGIPITVTAPPSPYQQLTLNGLIYNPGSGGGWTFALQNCSQGVQCTRNFQVKNTGVVNAGFFLTDSSDGNTTVTETCPSTLSPGQTCNITIKHTLPSGTAKRNGGDLSVANAVPAESSYEICIEDTDIFCR